MVPAEVAHSLERVAIVEWTARIGAVTAEALAHRSACSLASARSQLVAAERLGLLRRSRPLVGQPALYTVTRAGLRLSGLRGLEPSRVSAAGTAHAIACAEAAARLERCHPDHRVVGERELRREERECGAALASASLGSGPGGSALLHRPDLVLWPVRAAEGLPVAVEVELTAKSPQRLAAICRAWARCRRVAGVLYLAPPAVQRALVRAVSAAHAHERIVVVPLDALAGADAARAPASGETVPTRS